MCCATCATPTAASTPPRTPTHPTSTATGTKGCSTRGRPTRCARSSAKSAEAALEWYGITESGNFEGRSIPNRLTARGQLARTPEIEAARQRLFDARAQRSRPLLDDKVITEWNALFLATLAEAAAMLGRADWLQAAIDNGEFLLRELRRPDGRWHRSWQADGTPPARHDALAADHAALVDAFTRLAEASGQARWIDAARETADVLLDHFWDVDHGGVFTTADDGEQLVARQKDILDNATPSANSTAANALTRLAALTGEMRYANHADRILQLLGTVIRQAPGGVSNALLGIETRGRGITEVAIVGDRPDLVRLTQSLFRPDVVLAWGERYDSPLWHERTDGLAYVCRDYACEAPQDTRGGLLPPAHRAGAPGRAHQPPRWMISFGRRRDRPVLRPGGSTPGSSHR